MLVRETVEVLLWLQILQCKDACLSLVWSAGDLDVLDKMLLESMLKCLISQAG